MHKHNINVILEKIYNGNYSQRDLDIFKENIDIRHGIEITLNV